MSGLGRVLVGYRRSDTAKLRELELEYGLRAFVGGRCANCGHEVVFVQSGADAIRSRDPILFCDDPCWQQPDVKAAVMAEL